MSDPDKPWRLPDAKPMTFDEMTARAQYEWQRAEDAEAEARALGAERDALAEAIDSEHSQHGNIWRFWRDIADKAVTNRKATEAERDALAEKLEKAVEALREAETAPEPDHHVPQFRHVMDVIGATLAQITGGKTDDQHTD